MIIKKGGKYLTRSNHVVVINKIDKHGHFHGSIFGVRIGEESFDFDVVYMETNGLYYVQNMPSVLDIVKDISNEKAPIREYNSDFTLKVVDNTTSE